jgi:hypothetical protein
MNKRGLLAPYAVAYGFIFADKRFELSNHELLKDMESLDGLERDARL